MDETRNPLEQLIFDMLDRCKPLFFPDQWQNPFMNCSKNEAFTLIFIYRNAPVSMSEIANYLGVPLNTVTGIITRLEKNNWLLRARDTLDKRVVTVSLTEEGQHFLKAQFKSLAGYMDILLSDISDAEYALLLKLADRFATLVPNAPSAEKKDTTRVRKIDIL